MKYIVIIAAAIVSISAPCFAQVVVGTQGGLGFATQSMSSKENIGIPSISTMTGMTGGIMGRVSLLKNIGVQAELNYLRKGSHSMTRLIGIIQSYETHTDFMVNYFEIPVMLYYTLPSFIPMLDINVLAGPSIGLIESGRTKGYTLTTDRFTSRNDFDDVVLKQQVRSTDLSVTAGLGANVNLSSTLSIMLSGRYLLGLSNIIPDDRTPISMYTTESVQNRTIIVMAGVAVRL